MMIEYVCYSKLALLYSKDMIDTKIGMYEGQKIGGHGAGIRDTIDYKLPMLYKTPCGP
jgi:hypothetical protein